MSRIQPSPWLAPLCLAALLPAMALAEDGACPSRGHRGGDDASVSLRSDNDVYGRAHQDQNYTNGVVITLASPSLSSYTDDPCLPGAARWANGFLGWLQPEGFDQHRMVVRLSQGIYTPVDGTRPDLIADDRPYAGVAMLTMGYNDRRGDTLYATTLGLGWVGPSAAGEWGQDTVHRIFGRPRFKGWDNQLRDEPLLQVGQERMWRWRAAERPSGYGWDVVGHAGGMLGNGFTHANGGAEFRFGKFLPDGFSSDPMRPAGENTAPTTRRRDQSRWAWHVFAGLDTRWVLRDITLDGNTWKDSHSVDKEPLVAELSLGLVVTKGRWRFATTHYRRTKEFEGQTEAPVFGSYSVSVSF